MCFDNDNYWADIASNKADDADDDDHDMTTMMLMMMMMTVKAVTLTYRELRTILQLRLFKQLDDAICPTIKRQVYGEKAIETKLGDSDGNGWRAQMKTDERTN